MAVGDSLILDADPTLGRPADGIEAEVEGELLALAEGLFRPVGYVARNFRLCH